MSDSPSTLSMQLLGPLPTTWSAPPDCNNVSLNRKFETETRLGDASMYDANLESGTRCLPSGALTAQAYYSPGLCPSGWKSQAFTNGLEKTHNCCPPFAFDVLPETILTDGPHVRCAGQFYLTKVATIALYVDSRFERYTTTSNANPSTTVATYVVGSGIQVRFKDADFASSTSSSLSTSIASEAPVPTVTQAAARSGLPNGAKVGIGLAGSLVFAIIAFLAFYQYHKRRLRQPSLDPHESYKAELPGVGGGNVTSSGSRDDPGLEKGSGVLSSNGFVEVDGRGKEHKIVAELSDATVSESAIALSAKSTQPVIKQPGYEITPANELTDSANIAISDRQAHDPHITTVKDCSPETETSVLEEDADDDDELAYEERRLKERRELIAEKERLAKDEDALRERRAAARLKVAPKV